MTDKHRTHDSPVMGSASAEAGDANCFSDEAVSSLLADLRKK